MGDILGIRSDEVMVVPEGVRLYFLIDKVLQREGLPDATRESLTRMQRYCIGSMGGEG